MIPKPAHQPAHSPRKVSRAAVPSDQGTFYLDKTEAAHCKSGEVAWKKTILLDMEPDQAIRLEIFKKRLPLLGHSGPWGP